jgi:hypothetical protein
VNIQPTDKPFITPLSEVMQYQRTVLLAIALGGYFLLALLLPGLFPYTFPRAEMQDYGKAFFVLFTALASGLQLEKLFEVAKDGGDLNEVVKGAFDQQSYGLLQMLLNAADQKINEKLRQTLNDASKPVGAAAVEVIGKDG